MGFSFVSKTFHVGDAFWFPPQPADGVVLSNAKHASGHTKQAVHHGDGSATQDALAELTGQRTVPNVFIGGKHIGGCDATMAKNNKGELVSLLRDAGALSVTVSA